MVKCGVAEADLKRFQQRVCVTAVCLLGVLGACSDDQDVKRDNGGVDGSAHDAMMLEASVDSASSKETGTPVDTKPADVPSTGDCSSWSGWKDLTSQYSYTCIFGCGGKYIRCKSSGSSAGCWCASGADIIPRPGDGGVPWIKMCSPSIKPGAGACKQAFTSGCCG